MKNVVSFLLFLLTFYGSAAFGQERLNMYALSSAVQTLKNDPSPTAVSHHVVTVSLRKIYMGECGNDNHCHHEPVAGRVLTQFFHRQGGQIPSMLNRAQVWQSNGHSLTCDNLYGPADPDALTANDLQGDGLWQAPEPPRPLGQNQYAFYYDGFVNNVYFLRVIFNLGVNHQDNPLASVGGHWLTHGDNMIEEDITFDTELINRGGSKIIGPFVTDSNRCHEFFLMVTFSISE